MARYGITYIMLTILSRGLDIDAMEILSVGQVGAEIKLSRQHITSITDNMHSGDIFHWTVITSTRNVFTIMMLISKEIPLITGNIHCDTYRARNGNK